MIRELLLFSQIAAFSNVLSKSDSEEKCKGRCCANFYEDQYGSCLECPLGTYGLNCTGICAPQYYGRLCLSKCDCPSHYCDAKIGCVNYGIDNTCRDVVLALIGPVVTLVLFGLLFLMKSWIVKGCTFWRDGLTNQIENTENVHRYEMRRFVPSDDEIENVEPHGQTNESKYTELWRSALFPIYDNPDECTPGPNRNAAPADALKSVAQLNLSIDEEDDNSDEKESEIGGYGQLFKHDMYNVLSLRGTHSDRTIHLRQVSDDTIKSSSLNKTSDTNRIRKQSRIIHKMSRNLFEKATIRQNLKNETIEEYSQTLKDIKNNVVIEKEDEEQCIVMTGSNSQTKSTVNNKPLQKNIRPYSLAKASWSSDSTQNKNPIFKKINEDDDATKYDVVNKDNVNDDYLNQKENASEDVEL